MHTLEMLEEICCWYMFGEGVSRVLNPGNLFKNNFTGPHFLLHPQERRVKMAHLADSESFGYSNGRCGICAKEQVHFQSEIGSETLKPNAIAETFGNAGELCFTGRERYC